MAKATSITHSRATVKNKIIDRAKLGRLTDLKLKPSTTVRYCNAIMNLISWMTAMGQEWPVEKLVWIDALEQYAEHLWEEGRPLGDLGDVLSGLPHFEKGLRGHLQDVWKLYGVWKMHEIPTRAVPFSVNVLLAMVGLALKEGDNKMAAAYLLGFQALLRTGELCSILVKDVTFNKSFTKLVVNLGLTKGGRRRGCEETITTTDKATICFLRIAFSSLKKGDSLIGRSSQAFRKDFARHLTALGLQHVGYKPYSLRRGGATTAFQETGNLGLVALTGRWQNQATARIYINDGLKVLAETSFSADSVAKVQAAGKIALSIISSI